MSLTELADLVDESADDLVNDVAATVCSKGCQHRTCQQLIDNINYRAYHLRQLAEALRKG